MKKLCSFVLILCIILLCIPALAEEYFQFGPLKLNMPEGVKSSYQTGIYQYGNTQLHCTGNEMDEQSAAIAESLDATTFFDLWLDESVFQNISAYSNQNGVKYATFSTTAGAQKLSGICLYGHGNMVVVLAYGTETANIMHYIGKNAEITHSTNTTTSTANVQKTVNGYTLKNGPMMLSLSEDEWNILYKDMPSDARSLQRLGYTVGNANSLVSQKSAEIVLIPLNPSDNTHIYIKLKDKKYSHYSENEKAIFLIGNARQFSSEYTIAYVNGTTYYAYEAFNNQYRYSTIVNGDMIYIILDKDDTITSADKELLYKVIESISY